MTWAYFDTSALSKRYIDEPGRRDVQRLLRLHECVTSAVMPVELRSALRRRVSEGHLEEAQAAEVLERFAVDRQFWAFVDVSDHVLSAAEALVAVHPLRTLDAIHVASAELFSAGINVPKMPFVSADTRQIDAAATRGMAVKRVASMDRRPDVRT